MGSCEHHRGDECHRQRDLQRHNRHQLHPQRQRRRVSPAEPSGKPKRISAGSFGGFTMSGDWRAGHFFRTGQVTCAAPRREGGIARRRVDDYRSLDAHPLAFPASGTLTYTFPARPATAGIAFVPGSSINGDLASFQRNRWPNLF